MEFLLALMVLFLYAKVAGGVLHYLGFSSLIGEVAVGIILGPAILNMIQPTAGIESVAMLGLVVMMLVSGMSSRFDLLGQLKMKSLAISIPAAGLTFAFAFLVPYFLGIGLMPSLFIGIALSNTSTDILARMTRGHKIQSVLIGAALIDDIITVYAIGILSVLVTRQTLDITGFLTTTVGIILFFIAIIYLSKELMVKRNIMRVLWKHEERGGPIAFALILALALGVAAHQVGLHMIIGAYMAGLFISRLRERKAITLQSRIRLNKILKDVEVSLESVLTPIFFAYVGLQLAPDWGNINIILFLGLVLAAFGGKLIGGAFGATLVGYKKERVPIGVALCSRGALELALLHFGLQAGVIPQNIFSSMVFVVIITALLPPILLKYALKRTST
jgi:Kef-type K+ transport system membrane component KefB